MMEKRFWNIISYLLHPLFMPTLGVCFILATHSILLISIDSPFALLMIPWTVLGCTTLIPLFGIFTFLKAGRISSIEEPTKHDRLLIMLFSEIGFLASFIVLRHVPSADASLLLFLIGINVAMAVTLILNLFMRTSLHATGAGGLLGMVLGMEYYFRTDLSRWIGIALAIALISGYARYRVKAHRAVEIYYGYLVGLLSLSLVYMAGSWL